MKTDAKKASIWIHKKGDGLVKRIIEASYHRNGIAGVGFYAILFDAGDYGTMVASLFDEPGHCAVYNVAELAKGNIAFAQGNSWRGDDFEAELRPLIESMKTNRLGPFSLPG